MTTNRSFLTPGGLAAALICLVLTACGQPGSMDSGMLPMPDAYMGDGGPSMPDAYVPPNVDSGMPGDDAGTDAAAMMCTADMMLNRVSPPCDPDNNPDFGPGAGPTGLEGHVSGPGHVGPTWNTSTTMGFEIYLSTDAMGRIWISVPCGECGIVAGTNRFYFSADGVFYVNWVNRLVPGVQGNHARITFSADHTSAVLEVFDGGSDVPSMTVTLWAS
jgi:hypothetical protein